MAQHLGAFIEILQHTGGFSAVYDNIAKNVLFTFINANEKQC